MARKNAEEHCLDVSPPESGGVGGGLNGRMVPLFRPPLAPPDSGGESGSSSQGRLGGGLNDLVYGLRPADALILTKSYILEIAAFPDKYR